MKFDHNAAQILCASWFYDPKPRPKKRNQSDDVINTFDDVFYQKFVGEIKHNWRLRLLKSGRLSLKKSWLKVQLKLT